MKYFSTLLLTAAFLLAPLPAFAGGLQNAFGTNSPLSTVQQGSGAPTSDLGTIAGTIINTALSLVGIMFLILTVYAGFLWMTARGEEAQVEKATKIIRGSVIGLVITLSAYAITLFLTSRIVGNSSSSAATGTCSWTLSTGATGSQTNHTQSSCTAQCQTIGANPGSCIFN